MRKIWDFHGGVHPPENKVQSLEDSIRSAGIPSELTLPLSQHIGAPAKPIVAVGDKVLKGQKIAEAQGFVSVPVHAPTSGEIIAIEDRLIPHQSGLSAPCIVLKADGEERWCERKKVSDYKRLDKSELLEIIRDSGIAGMGGAGFPSAVKLGPKQPIDTLIINGTECEPYITADHVLMRERADKIIEGVRILQHLIAPSDQTLIGVEDNKPDGIAALRKAAEGTDIEVVEFPTKYPSGGEKQLIQILTGREVKSGGLPSEVGIVCQNMGTTVAIRDAVLDGEPLISRITTVTGEACDHNRNYEVLLGTPVSHLLKLSHFRQSDCVRLVMGGPMMGYTLADADVPVVKTTNCILAPTKSELPVPPPAQACIRCGLCAEACPVSLLPQQMYWFTRGQEWEKLEAHNIADCIECGACSYVCPSNIPLVQYYRAGKAELRTQEQERIKAEHSKQRFEARKERLEREEAEKEARRKARAEAAKARAKQGATKDDAKDDDPKAAVIAAAIARTKAKSESASEDAVDSPKESSADVDPAQAAIERAKAKREGKAPEETDAQKRDRLEQAIAKGEARLKVAEDKHAEAKAGGDATEPALASAVDKLRSRLQDQKDELAVLAKPEQSVPADEAVEPDPAADAIARAKAKREQAASQSPVEKAQASVKSLEARLEKTQKKLAEAREQGADNIEIFETSVQGIETKLEAAKSELAALEGTT